VKTEFIIPSVRSYIAKVVDETYLNKEENKPIRSFRDISMPYEINSYFGNISRAFEAQIIN
jgi:hypothetical protein